MSHSHYMNQHHAMTYRGKKTYSKNIVVVKIDCWSGFVLVPKANNVQFKKQLRLKQYISIAFTVLK